MATFLRTTARLTAIGGTSLDLLGFNWIPGTVGGSNADATDCLARFRSMWQAMVSGLVFGALITFDGTVLAYDDSTGTITDVYTGTVPSNVVGSQTGDALPLQTQGLIRWNTAGITNGRRVRGRTFVPNVPEFYNGSQGAPSAPYVTILNLGVAALLTAGSTASLPCIWHRPGPHGPGSLFQVQGGVGSSTWSVQRKRR